MPGQTSKAFFAITEPWAEARTSASGAPSPSMPCSESFYLLFLESEAEESWIVPGIGFSMDEVGLPSPKGSWHPS